VVGGLEPTNIVDLVLALAGVYSGQLRGGLIGNGGISPPPFARFGVQFSEAPKPLIYWWLAGVTLHKPDDRERPELCW
jgi:hypothetical protein